MDVVKHFFDVYLSAAWLGTLVSIFGVVLSILLYRLAKSRKQLYWCHHGMLLLGGAHRELPPGITVQYNEQQIPRLTRVRIWLWNPSDPTIHGTDLEPSDPLRIRFETDGEVLAATVLQTNRPVTNVTASVGTAMATEVVVHFNFLDKRDGALIEVLHTGENVKPSLIGTVRGIPRGPRNRGSATPINAKERTKRRVVKLVRGAVTFVPIILGSAVIVLSLLFPNPLDTAAQRWNKAIFGLGYVALGVLYGYRYWRRYPKSLDLAN